MACFALSIGANALTAGAALARTVVFLGDRDLAPYEFLVNGVPRGANVDLAHAIGRALGRPVQVELLDWSEAQRRVRTEDGAVLTFLGRTPEREREFDFTQTTFPVSFALFIREGDERHYSDRPLAEVLAGRRIGVTAAGLARTLLEQNHPEAQFVIVDNLLDGTRRLVSREIDAFGAQVWSQTFLLSELGIRGVTHLPPFAERHGNIAVPRGNPALLAELDRALTQVKASGEFGTIIDHWSTTRLRLVSESTIIALAVTGGVGGAGLVLLAVGLVWTRRQRAQLKGEIEERRKAEQALRESQLALQMADRSKDEFIATLAHELRNPLAPISNAIHVLELGHSDASRQAREVIRRQTEHLTRLIDDLLDVGRITSGKLELRRAPVLLSTVILDAVEASRPMIERFGHRLDVDQPAEDTWIAVDRARLVQILMNLLTNAAKYTPQQGRIQLTATVTDDDMELRVRDSGVGIDDASLADIFEMFHQEDRSRSLAHGGLGIGLWLTRQLVRLHGGTIEASSEGRGLGAQFVVRLPAVRRAPAEDRAPAEARTTADAHLPLRVLVADDNADSAETTALLLSAEGCLVEAVYDGEQALQTADAFRPQLVFLDLAMPKATGHEVCRRLRATDWGGRVTIVAMTGWGGESDRAATRETGFDHHLVKPVDVEMLRRLVRDGRRALATPPRGEGGDGGRAAA